ncbi:MAG: response regulator transcription factor [Lachnospiraceae bacterium]|nr:response regulator transcription factor [Lachnospiraceae bacterium]
MFVYVVEDDVNISEIECYTLKNSGHNVTPVYSAQELSHELQRKIPDMIILDIMLPDEDGIRVLGKLQKNVKTKEIPVIMVTARSSEMEKVKCLDAGADDYITKPFGIMEFNARVNALLRRTKKNDTITDLISVGNITIDNEKRTVTVDGEEQNVTFKEYELLKYLMINRGIVLSRDKIMEAVWGFDFQGESRTVDMHIKTLRQKIGSERKRIKTVRNVGYKID